jgi:hypothetical protein
MATEVSGAGFVRGNITQVHGSTWNNGRNGMFVDHLRDRIAQKDYVLIKGFDLALELDAVDQVNRDGHMLAAQRIQERVLQELTFVAHDILRVQK